MQRPAITQQVIDTFAKVLDDQDVKGVEKYNKTIDEAEGYDWKLMALEEAADLVKYLTKELEEQKANTIKLLDREIAFAKGCGMPQFVMGLQQAKKVIEIGEYHEKG